jgi:hypothetical protein
MLVSSMAKAMGKDAANAAASSPGKWKQNGTEGALQEWKGVSEHDLKSQQLRKQQQMEQKGSDVAVTYHLRWSNSVNRARTVAYQGRHQQARPTLNV